MNIKIIPYILDTGETHSEGKALKGVPDIKIFDNTISYKIEDVNGENLDLICKIALAQAEGEPSVVVPGGFAFYDGEKFLFADRYFSFSKKWIMELNGARQGAKESHALSNEDVYDIQVKDNFVWLKRRCGSMPDLQIDLKSFEAALKNACIKYEAFKIRFVESIRKLDDKRTIDSILASL